MGIEIRIHSGKWSGIYTSQLQPIYVNIGNISVEILLRRAGSDCCDGTCLVMEFESL